MQDRTAIRILQYDERQHSGLFTRISVRFKGQFCYMDAFTEPVPPSPAMLELVNETAGEYLARLRNTPVHLVRLRYFKGRDLWSLAFYTYSQERYEPIVFLNGEWFGSTEDPFDVGAVYLQEG